MRFKKTLFFVVLSVLVLSGGCGIISGKVSTPPGENPYGGSISSSERSYVTALHYLRTGQESQSRDLLVRIVDESYQAGVADEAMFRLALLYLREEDGKGERRATELLDRLSKEFPESIWTRQAAPLSSYLKSSTVLRAKLRELKLLRNQNLSLSRDNKELRQSLDRIKNLDIELEQKIRR